MIRQLQLDMHDEIIVDNFAGGGGASTGIEMALGRPVTIAINHDPEAVALHALNHPQTRHLIEDVFAVDPKDVCGSRRVGLAWFSPDCKHFSKAKGGKPRDKKIRGLAWVAVKWAATVRPRVIILENVEEFLTWGPILCDGSPCPRRKGDTFRRFVGRLRGLGYAVEFRELRACDYGAPTIRKRLFLIARCDGDPIVWPEKTHGKPSSLDVRSGRLKPWRTAAECIDWEKPCHSIFLTREEGRQVGVKRPLADATMRRIARGIKKYVIDASNPFLVPLTHHGSDRVEPLSEPMRPVTGAHRGERAVVVPMITEHANGSSPRSMPANEPLRTQCAETKGGHFAQVTAFLAKHFSGAIGSDGREPVATVTATDHNAAVAVHLQRDFGQSVGHGAQDPMGTVTGGGGGKVAVLASTVSKLYGTTTGQPVAEPLHTVTGGGQHLAEVRAFLLKYYGSAEGGVPPGDPMHTVTATDRLGLVMVRGEPHYIVDIGMRMLEPRELYNAQGFPKDYLIQPVYRGKGISKSAQVRMAGNSVCPPLAAALVRANLQELVVGYRGIESVAG